jgi:hypothetical protein
MKPSPFRLVCASIGTTGALVGVIQWSMSNGGDGLLSAAVTLAFNAVMLTWEYREVSRFINNKE